MPTWLDQLLSDYGYWAIALAVFLNNIGIPVPGDIVMVGGGFFAQQGILSKSAVVALGAGACFAGGQLSYFLGRRYGRRLFVGSRRYQISPARLELMDQFFRRFGNKAIFLGRFLAVVHPVTGLLSGMGKAPWRPFIAYNLLGSLAYALAYASLGYFFGASWEILSMWMGRAALVTLAALILLAALTLFFRKPLVTAMKKK